jgi:hypothetical protein
MATYTFLYPFPEESLARLAYYFDFDYAPDKDPRGYAGDVTAYCEHWKRSPTLGAVTAVRRPDGSLGVVDSRPDASLRACIFQGAEQAIFEYCDEVHSLAAIIRHIDDIGLSCGGDENAVRGFLDSLVVHGWMVRDGDRYLALA